jgi:hypothetical protein
MIKTLATAIALILTLSIATTAFAQGQNAITTTSSTPVQVSAQDIQRGNTQTIHIETGSPGDVIGKVTYPSGHQVIFQGTTDEFGVLDYSFKVGGNTKPGTATIDILASTDEGRASGSTTFGVYPKGALIPIPTPTPPTPTPPIEVPAAEENVTATPTPEPIPIENETTTAPEEPIVIAPENETTVITPDNSTDIIPPVNETSVIIPSNETTVPDPVENETEVIIAPENETDIVTGDNASEVPQVPDDIIDEIEDPVIIVPGNETTVGENVTVSEPLPDDVVPIDNATNAGNVTDIIVIPPGEEIPANVTEPEPGKELPENITEAIPPEIEGNATQPVEAENVTVIEPPSENITETPPIEENITAPAENMTIGDNATVEAPITPNGTTPLENITIEAPTEGNVTVETPDTNVTVTEPEPEPLPPVNVTTPDEAIDLVENQTEALDQAVDSGNVDEIIVAMQNAISAQQTIINVVQSASEDERDAAEEAVNNMNDRIAEAFNEVSEGGE